MKEHELNKDCWCKPRVEKAKDRPKLTRASNEQLRRQHNGTGFLIYKSSDSTLTSTEFYIGKDNRIYYLNDMIRGRVVEFDFDREVD